MSLFSEYELEAKVYHPLENTGRVTYSSTPDLTTKMTIREMSAEDKIMLGELYGTFYTYTSSSAVLRGDKIEHNSRTYFVTSVPTELNQFNERLIYLRAERL